MTENCHDIHILTENLILASATTEGHDQSSPPLAVYIYLLNPRY